MLLLKRIAIYGLFQIILLSGMAQASVESSIDKHGKLFLNDSRIQSLSIGVHFAGKNYSKHFGEQTIGSAIPPNNRTIYEIASVTKVMTGYVAAQAVVDGKVRLDVNINQYLSTPLNHLSPAESPLTIRHLLTHTSGLPNMLDELDNNHQAIDKLTYLKLINNLEFTKKRGEFNYSNIAPDLLAYVLEQVYKQPFETLLQKAIHQSAGTHEIFLSLPSQLKSRLAYGYNADGKPMKAFDGAPQLWGAAGRVKTTMRDLLRFMTLQLSLTNPIVKESHKTLLASSTRGPIAYFWQRQKSQDGIYFQHHGGLFGTQNWMLIYPEYRLGISIISNASFPQIGQLLRDTADAIVDDIKPFGKKSIRLALRNVCSSQVAKCIERYKKLKQEHYQEYDFKDENQLNNLGYSLLFSNNVNEAVEVFSLLVSEFPASANPYDSLAEGYMLQQNYACALANYQRTLSIKNDNANAKKVVNKLQQQGVKPNTCQQ